MKSLSLLACLLVFALPAAPANAVLATATYDAAITTLNASGGIPGVALGNGIDMTLSYDGGWADGCR